MPKRKGGGSRKHSGGGGRRDRSTSSQASWGPHSGPEAVFWKPWHQQPVFSRFWEHYATLMEGAPLTALGHAAFADACGSCCCCRRRGLECAAAPTHPQAQAPSNTRKRQAENLCRKHKQQQKKRSKQQQQHPHHVQTAGPGAGAPSEGYRDPVPGYYDSDAGGYYDPKAGYDDAYDEDDAGYYDPDTGYYYDTPYDQESASELTSQLNAGMHIADQGETVEPSEEFLAFIAESARHREEWKKRKALMNQEAFLPPSDMELDEQGREKEPKEHPDSVRSREMKELYGDAAPRIHAMETAVQLAFERVATRRHTKLWPNIPINVIFEDEA